MTSEKIWSIPYIDQPVSFWQELADKFDNYIDEVYFPLHLDDVASGRPILPAQHLNEFLEKAPFQLSILVNPIILSRPVEEISGAIIESIKEFYGEYNIHSVTVANVALAEKIKESIPELMLTASVLMDIFSPNQLAMIDGIFDFLVPSSRIVRNLPALSSLKKSFKGSIKIIVNEGCLPNCVFRTQHFYEMGTKLEFPKSLCNEILEKKPWLRLTGSWILPQHLHFYHGSYDKLKLAGRVTLQNPDYYQEVFDAYVFRKKRFPNKIGGGPASIKLPMHIDDEFFKQTLYCDKECHRCTICQEKYEQFLKSPG
jgi:collagenase-like PrtC family protease